MNREELKTKLAETTAELDEAESQLGELEAERSSAWYDAERAENFASNGEDEASRACSEARDAKDTLGNMEDRIGLLISTFENLKVVVSELTDAIDALPPEPAPESKPERPRARVVRLSLAVTLDEDDEGKMIQLFDPDIAVNDVFFLSTSPVIPTDINTIPAVPIDAGDVTLPPAPGDEEEAV